MIAVIVFVAAAALAIAIHNPMWIAFGVLLATMPWIPIWPVRVELTLLHSPYETARLEMSHMLDIPPSTPIRVNSRFVWLPRSMYAGFVRYSFSLADMPKQFLLFTSSKAGTYVRLRSLRLSEIRQVLAREDVVMEKCKGYYDYQRVYHTQHPQWIAIRPSRLKGRELHPGSLRVTRKRTVVVRVAGKEHEMSPDLLSIVVEPGLERAYLIPRLDFEYASADVCPSLIVLPSTAYLATISDGSITDLIAVAYRHPGVLCSKCWLPHGNKGGCYCSYALPKGA